MSTEPAAPVITDEGTWGAPPPPFQAPPAGRGWRAWLSLSFVIAVALWLSTFSLWQLTGEQLAHATAERALAALSEVDALLVVQETTICEHLAVGGGPAGSVAVEVPGFAVPGLRIAGDAVRCTNGHLDRAALRNALLTQGADALMSRGTDAFHAPDRAPDRTSSLSRIGAVRALLDLLASPLHEWAALLVWPLAIATLLLGGIVVASEQGTQRFARAGLQGAAGALPVLLGAVAVRLLADALAGGPDDLLLQELASITRSLAALPLRDALWLGAGGLAIAIAARVTERAGSRG